LGDIYTLVLHPATSSHRSLSVEERERIGISDRLVRLSVGIEDAADIIADMEQALAAV
jgi:cystathionine beta-lyase/cystathionine gamma-synthase